MMTSIGVQVHGLNSGAVHDCCFGGCSLNGRWQVAGSGRSTQSLLGLFILLSFYKTQVPAHESKRHQTMYMLAAQLSGADLNQAQCTLILDLLHFNSMGRPPGCVSTSCEDVPSVLLTDVQRGVQGETHPGACYAKCVSGYL